jgi:hypothetical protein
VQIHNRLKRLEARAGIGLWDGASLANFCGHAWGDEPPHRGTERLMVYVVSLAIPGDLLEPGPDCDEALAVLGIDASQAGDRATVDARLLSLAREARFTRAELQVLRRDLAQIWRRVANNPTCAGAPPSGHQANQDGPGGALADTS